MQRKSKVKESKDSKETNTVETSTERIAESDAKEKSTSSYLSTEDKIKNAEKLESELEQELLDIQSMIASTKDKGAM